MTSPEDRAAELRRQLDDHSHRYYVLDDPEIGDDQYDALLDELRAIEAEHPELVTPDSPTQRVGGEPVSDLEKVRHPQRMLSLSNAHSADDMRAWVQRMRNHLAREGIDDPQFRVRRRAEDRRTGDVVAVPRRSVRTGGDARATARSARTSPTTSARSGRSRSARSRGPAATARGPRRGLHVAAGLRRAQRAPRGGGAVDVHEPAQLGGRDDPAARSEARGCSARCRSGPTRSG